MPDGPPLAKLAAVVNALSSPSVGYFVNWCARPSLSRWILRFRVIPERYAIAFACMPDGPSLACRTARVLDRCVVRQQSLRSCTPLACRGETHSADRLFYRLYISHAVR